ncbi:hypothetical protein D9M71_586750 [compost metagenome]
MFLPLGGLLFQPQQIVVETHHPVRGGPAAGEFGKVVDRPGECRGQLLEGLRGLHQHPQGHAAGNVLGRHDQDREHRQQHAVTRCEGHDPRIGERLPIPAAAQLGKNGR